LSCIPNLKPSSKVTLIYRATRDGWNQADFHRLCDGNGPSLVLLKVKSNARVCGGYTSVGFGSECGWKSDNQALLFSIDTATKFPLKEENTIYHDQD
jgi:hypothetical protein